MLTLDGNEVKGPVGRSPGLALFREILANGALRPPLAFAATVTDNVNDRRAHVRGPRLHRGGEEEGFTTMSDEGRRSGPSAMGERIRWVIEERLGTSHAEFARRLGVKPPQLSRWINRADFPPGEGYAARIAALGGVPLAWLRYGVGAPDESPASGDELAAEELFRHFEGMVRRMGGAGVRPEELKLRKLDVVDGLSRLYAAQGAIPGWVYDLKGRILRDEL